MNDCNLYPLFRFSNIENKEVEIYFPEGLFGLREEKHFSLCEDRKVDPYFFLERRGKNFRFIVCDPFYFFPHYAPTISRFDLDALQVKEGAILLLLTLVNVKGDSPKLNMTAPILVDWQQKIGRQIVVEV